MFNNFIQVSLIWTWEHIFNGSYFIGQAALKLIGQLPPGQLPSGQLPPRTTASSDNSIL